MQLLILTCQDDLHADAVIRLLSEREPAVEVIRVNTDNLPTNIDYSFQWASCGETRSNTLRVRDANVAVTNASVVWYRKPDRPPPHPALSDENAQECSVLEYREFLRSFPGFFPQAIWVNEYWRMQRYSIKSNQIPVARSVGLDIPETLITNDLDSIKKFARRHDEIIVKPMAFSGFAVGREQYACYTSALNTSDVDRIDERTLDYAPAIFQQRINKVQELRVTVIGNEVFACEIQTEPGMVENIDWRIKDVEDLPHILVDLPAEVCDRLRKMLFTMGLNFGAFDLIQDETGRYYFIEVNPNGQYYWIELLTGARLSAAMADLIVRLSENPSGDGDRLKPL